MLPLPLTTFGSSSVAGVVLLIVILLAVTAVVVAIVVLRWKHNKRYVTYARFSNDRETALSHHSAQCCDEAATLSSVQTITTQQMTCPLTGGAACIHLQNPTRNEMGESTAAQGPNSSEMDHPRTSFVGMNRPLLTENSRI